MSEAVRRFLPLLDQVAKEFCQMLQTKVEKEGRGERGKRSLTIDPSPDLFRFALEGLRLSDHTCETETWFGGDAPLCSLASFIRADMFDLELWIHVTSCLDLILLLNHEIVAVESQTLT